MKEPQNMDAVRQYMSELGKVGGKLGGKRSLETMTRRERIARAIKAGKASGLARKRKARKAVALPKVGAL